MRKLNNKIKDIPHLTGCYIYKNKTGKIIYVGKAKDLKKRVSSYFQKKDHDFKTNSLVEEIFDVECLATKNEVEALLLEARLIRENRPKYNIDLKDSIRYAYLKITKEKFPRLLTSRRPSGKGRFFGPYTDGSKRAKIALLGVRLFKIRTCKSFLKQPCLQYHIGNCLAPCAGLVSEKDYNKNINELELFLKGDIKKLNNYLKLRMDEASKVNDFELAKIFRDQLRSLEILSERQSVDLLKKVDQDVINFILYKNKILLQIFHIKKGAILNREKFEFRCLRGEELRVLTSFIKQYYATSDVPHEIILPFAIEEQSLIVKYLEQVANRKVLLTIPKRGTKRDLLEMVKNNLILSLNRENQPLADLQDKLSLDFLPEVIECFDISNLGSSSVVGAMVCFRGGKPDKNSYRRFKIKGNVGQDDFAAMAEIVGRRYRGVKKNGLKLPDLIVVDGGLGQLHSAQRELERLNLEIPIIGLAKREESIYTFNSSKPIQLGKKTEALKLLQNIRDEAHRFAISFHRKKRRKF